MANAPLSVAASKQVIVEQRDGSIAHMFMRQQPITGHLLSSDDAMRCGRASDARTPRS